MKKIVRTKARGTQDTKGLYNYTVEEAKQWNESFGLFNRDIYKLAALYPSEAAKKNGK
jgi:hypothetical protein